MDDELKKGIDSMVNEAVKEPAQPKPTQPTGTQQSPVQPTNTPLNKPQKGFDKLENTMNEVSKANPKLNNQQVYNEALNQVRTPTKDLFKKHINTLYTKDFPREDVIKGVMDDMSYGNLEELGVVANPQQYKDLIGQAYDEYIGENPKLGYQGQEDVNDVNLIDNSGNISLKEWFNKNKLQLEGKEENKNYVVESMLDKFNISQEQAEKYYDEHIGEQGQPNQQDNQPTQTGQGSTNEQFDKVVNAAKNYFGTTNNFYSAFYMLPDGTMLDGSGMKLGSRSPNRSIDHREINSAYLDNNVELNEDDIGGNSAYMEDFMKHGAIRIMPENNSIEVVGPLTDAQKSSILQLVSGKYLNEIEINNQLYDVKSYDQVKNLLNNANNGEYSLKTMTPITEEQINNVVSQKGYPKGTSEEYRNKVNQLYNQSLPILQKYGIDINQIKSYDDVKPLMEKHLFTPFRQKYGNGNNEVWNRDYKPLYDALDAVGDKLYNDWYTVNAPNGY